jgi:succinate dehydrogenase/fumarate reductase flavoprotein subunit
LKNLKKPTYAQKLKMTKAKLDAREYLVKEEGTEGLVVFNKETGKFKVIKGKVVNDFT